MATTARSRRTTTRSKKDTSLAVVPPSADPADGAAFRPEPYLLNLDPRDLLRHPSNPRRDYGDLTELRQTIAVQGVVQALTVIPEDDGHRVVAGHRRAAAAAEALDAGEWPTSMPHTVPCVVRPDLDGIPADQILAMLVENDHRKDLTVSEQAAGYAQLRLFDIAPEEIARRTGRTVKHVTMSLKLHDFGDKVAAAADIGHVTLDDIAVLEKEFAGDAKVVDRILQGSNTTYGVQHNIDMERRKRAQDAAAEKFRQELKAAGVKEVRKPKGWPNDCPATEIKNLVDAAGKPVDREQVQAQEGFGAFIEKQYGGATVTYICLDPKASGLRRKHGGGYVAPEDKAAAARAKEARDQALTDAQDVREKFMAQTYGTAKAAKVLLVDALRATLMKPSILERGDEELVRALAGGGDINDVADAKIDRLQRLLVAQWIASQDDMVERVARFGLNNYASKPAGALAWFDRLQRDGYELSEVETTVYQDCKAYVDAEAKRRAETARLEAEAETRRAAETPDGSELAEDEQNAPSRCSLFYLPDPGVWVLSHDDSGQPMGELPAGPDAVEQAQQWASGLLSDLRFGGVVWRQEHDDDAGADYYVTVAEEEPAVTEPPAVAEEESVIAVAEVVPTGAPAEGQGVEH